MDISEAMKKRHSVRAYTDKKIEGEVLFALENKIAEINGESGLNAQLVLNEDKAFGGRMARYGKFSGVKNYIAMVGKKNADLSEKVGYYGQKLVLFAQALGLNTCWVALSYKKVKSAYKVGEGEKPLLVIAIGYGATQGVPHKSKNVNAVSNADENSPEWFVNGVKAALLAPTAMNQQKFFFTLKNGAVTAKPGLGFYAKTDLGIAKYQFELGSGVKLSE